MSVYDSLLGDGWRMADIDQMDMPGYLSVRVWKATRGARKNAPQRKYIDEVWKTMTP